MQRKIPKQFKKLSFSLKTKNPIKAIIPVLVAFQRPFTIPIPLNDKALKNKRGCMEYRIIDIGRIYELSKTVIFFNFNKPIVIISINAIPEVYKIADI